MKRLAVIGIGSAGIQSLAHFLAWLEGGWEVVSIHDPNINIVGIGESTNPPFFEALQNGTDFNLVNDIEKLDGTLKFGVEYINWRKKSFINPLVGGNIALHINTFKLAEFALPRMRKIWKEKFKEILGNVSSVENKGDFVSVVVDNVEHYFDYVVDCRGFAKNFEHYQLIEDMPVNHCLVHNAPPTSSTPYGPINTGHIATENGWMFHIPLLSRDSYGYLFNDKITDIEDAKKDFAKTISVPVESIGDIEYKFDSYYTTKLVDGRILKNGNSAVFFEPMFANSLWVYSVINRLAFSFINGEIDEVFVNEEFMKVAVGVEAMISYHYHGGSIYNSDFWNYAKGVTSPKAQTYLSVIAPQLRHYSQNNYMASEPGWVFAPKVLFNLDKNFEYGYFT